MSRQLCLSLLLLVAPLLAQSRPLVDLDAADPSAGSPRWTNAGTLQAFERIGSPERVLRDGVPAVAFNQKTRGDAYRSVENAPAELVGSTPTRSIEVWVHNEEITPEETLVAWGRRGGPAGSNMSFNFGSNPEFGAVGHWGGPDLGWKKVPPRSRWNYLVYTCDGLIARVYANGVETNHESFRPGEIQTHEGTRITLAAQLGGNGAPEFAGLEGRVALGRVRVHGRLLSADEIAATYERERPNFPISPRAPTITRAPAIDAVRADAGIYRATVAVDGEPTPTVRIREPLGAKVSTDREGALVVELPLAKETTSVAVVLEATNASGVASAVWTVHALDLQRPVSAADRTFYRDEVHPVLSTQCFACHGGGERLRGGLVLTDREGALRGGERGAVLNVDAPRESLLLSMISYQDEHHQMPPRGKLKDNDLEVLTRWVLRGLPFDPALETRPADVADDRSDFLKRRDFWSYRPVEPVSPPTITSPWIRNDVDRFIFAKLEEEGLSPAKEADPVTLLRRATYDLTGLPPTTEEVRTFLKDREPGAYERAVERLLESPHYGEKWGRHWLDLVRYAETNGYERDGDKPFVWRYRDYVIRAFNEDKPYARFLKEQLAGDELDDVTDDSLIATGYYTLMTWDDEPGAGKIQGDADVLADIVSTTGEALLGMTVGCARCHDHKKDPIRQDEFYSLMAFFAGLQPYGQEANLRDLSAKGSPRRGGRRPRNERDGALRALCVRERGGPVPDTFVHVRGNALIPGRRVNPALPESLCAKPLGPIPPRDAGRSSGRRRVLAEWIASEDNPRTWRVMANRVWQHHFGTGLCPTPSDFGWLGQPPTHPELLDWLGQEFVRVGGSLKALHRLMMLSSTYRMGHVGDIASHEQDPRNQQLSRFSLRRLGAEEVRDSILSVTGTLNFTMFGPSVFPPLPKEVLATSSKPNEVWGKSSKEDAARRTLYAKVKRSLKDPLLESHDMADTDQSCPVRFTTTVPTQALTMLNGAFLNEQSALFADRLRREAGARREDQIRLGLLLVTQRVPSDDDVARQVGFLDTMMTSGLNEDQALVAFCLLLLNLNEFVYV